MASTDYIHTQSHSLSISVTSNLGNDNLAHVLRFSEVLLHGITQALQGLQQQELLNLLLLELLLLQFVDDPLSKRR